MAKPFDVDVIVHLTERDHGVEQLRVVQGDIEPDEVAACFNRKCGTESGSEESDDWILWMAVVRTG